VTGAPARLDGEDLARLLLIRHVEQSLLSLFAAGQVSGGMVRRALAAPCSPCSPQRARAPSGALTAQVTGRGRVPPAAPGRAPAGEPVVAGQPEWAAGD